MLNFNALTRILHKKIYFTIHTGNQGFTDQMMQFSAFYKLGLALGYHYIYTPFISVRSMPLIKTIDRIKTSRFQDSSDPIHDQVDIYDFLGFNQYFDVKEFHLENEKVEDLEIELSDSILDENHIFSFSELKSHIRDYVAKNKKTKNNLRIIFRLERKKPPEGKGKREFFSLIHTDVPAFKDELDFHSMYFKTRKNDPIPSQFEDDKIKILVHIRQGDTSFIETSWNTFIPVDSRRPDFLTEQVNYEQMKSSYSNNFVDSLFQPAEYYGFLKKLLSYFEDHVFSTLSFSDGYHRAFGIIEKNINRLQLSSEKKESLSRIKDSYDETKFRIFKNIKGSKCIIGETQENLHTLIHSTLIADIIIVAAQQRMLPKLAANFCKSNTPFIIVLYRNKIPDYSDVIQNDDDRYIYTDIDNPDFKKIVDRIDQLIKNLLRDTGR